MEATIGKSYLQTCHWEATEYTILQAVLESLLYRWDELLRNITTLYLVDKLKIALCVVFVLWSDGNIDTSELTTTTRLLLVCLTALCCRRDSLLVVNLWLTLVALYLELALQTVNDDIEVKLTHTRDNSLAALLVSTYGKCWVLLSELGKTVVKLGNVGLALWFNSDRDNCIREGHRLEYDWVCLIAESVTSTDILESNTCADVTSINCLHRNFLVGVHLEEAADALLLSRAWVVNV